MQSATYAPVDLGSAGSAQFRPRCGADLGRAEGGSNTDSDTDSDDAAAAIDRRDMARAYLASISVMLFVLVVLMVGRAAK